MLPPPAWIVFVLIVLAVSGRAAAQQRPGSVTDRAIADRHEVISEREHHYVGNVEIELGDTRLYADDVWYYVDRNQAIATGNVVFRQGTSQIAADRAEFDTGTRLGTFYNASGFATVQPPQRSGAGPGVAPPPVPGQDTIVYFFGETVEKTGPRRYRIRDGGFTTCVQPTPRWDFHAGTILLNLDHYTLLRNVVMEVKGVPLLYLPAIYYPTNREDRATGLLLPTYGTSTLRGQSLHNAFFWAINRSQDATLMHDWFSKTGQGYGGEYRYNFGGGADGSLRGHLLDEHEFTYVDRGGALATEPAQRSFSLDGTASQMLPGRLRARAHVDYFSSIATNQTFSTNVSDISQSQRRYGGNLVGAWGGYSLNGTVERREYFYSPTSSNVSGSWPRVALSRNERRVPGTPLYVAANGEFASIVSENRQLTTVVDKGLSRVEFVPRVRIPFRRWQWFTANSTVTWRETYYSRSRVVDPITGEPADDPVTGLPLISDTNLNRQHLVLQTQLTGPVLNRVWDTPQNGYAEKFKHTVEPFVNVSRTTAIDNAKQVVAIETDDYTVGGVTQYTYGLANRLYAKRRSPVAGQAGQSREILNIELRQTYSTSEEAARVDPQYASSHTGDAESRFSPVLLTFRAEPTGDFNLTGRAEFDARHRELRYLSMNGSYAWTSRVQSSFGWSKRAFIADLEGFNDPARLDHSLAASSTVRTRDNRYGGTYAFDYDVLRRTMIQQRMTGYYNAQCCGVAFEYQNRQFGNRLAFAGDRRFFMSFTLAGLGNFSPFSGALGGVPR